jgi:hypothetical protein
MEMKSWKQKQKQKERQQAKVERVRKRKIINSKERQKTRGTIYVR